MHAELSWPGGGCLVFGSTEHTDSVHGAMKPGTTAVYVITDNVDTVYERVLQAEGGTVVQAPNSTQFGSGAETYAFTAGDPEGNLWTFGTYQGAVATAHKAIGNQAPSQHGNRSWACRRL